MPSRYILRFITFGTLFLIWLSLASCGKSPQPGSHLQWAGPEVLSSAPATGVHYAQTAWATVHRDSGNSDYVPLNPTANVKLQWSALEGAALLVGPVIGPEGNLYVPTGQGQGYSHLHAYSNDGTLLWQSPVMRGMQDFDYAAVVCAPIVDTAGNVFAADSNQLWSFTPTGEIRWVADLRAHGIEGFFVTPVFSKEGFVGGVSTDGKVALFYRETGTLAVPVLDLPGVAGPPSEPLPPGLWDGMLAEPFKRPLWDLIYGREIEVANTPAVHPVTGRIFITAGGNSAEEGVLYAIDTSTETVSIAFTATMGAGSGTSPAISPDGRYVYAIDDSGVMFGFETDSGNRAWAVADTMGQASPSVGPDGTIYSFNGLEGTIVAVEGNTGTVKWIRQYDDVARQHLRWIPGLPRSATVDGLITVTDNGIWAFLDLNYSLGSGEQQFPQPRKVVVVHLDVNNGDVLGWFESPDSSGAFMVPDADGMLYLSLSGAATSISYLGVNNQLPFFLQSPFRPRGGLVALRQVDRSQL